jgi:hypothetical protein
MVNTSRPLADDIARARAAETASGCWPWQGNINDSGYGRRRVGTPGILWRAHVLVYVELVGPIPDGFELDHTCHTNDPACPGGRMCLHRRCVRPVHLEPVTPGENWLRGRSLSRQAMDVTHCPQGHPYSLENTYLHQGRGRLYRRCRICIRASNRRSEERRRLIYRVHGG